MNNKQKTVLKTLKKKGDKKIKNKLLKQKSNQN